MEWKPRLIDPDELRAVANTLAVSFGDAPFVGEPQFAQLQAVGESDRTFVVDDGSVIVGTGATYTFRLAVPGGALPMAA